MSLSSTYLSRKELIADNLQSMGVSSADADDGLTTLANKILDIEPSISGLDLDTSLILHSSDDECLVGQSIMFWAELKADYDDETATDVDLSGVLTGATVTFKNGNTVLGTGVTDANGIAYYTHTFATVGTYNITASFAGTENFDDCVSSSITVSVTYEITITADKPILSFADSDIANITATLTDGSSGVSGETLSYEILDKEDNVLDSGSDVTDSLGEISFTYQSAGVGDVQVIVYYGILLQETYGIQDCDYYADSTKISNWNNVSSGGTQFKVSTYTVGLSNFSVEMKFNTIDAQIMIGNQNSWLGGVSLTDKNLYTHSSSGGTVTTVLIAPIATDVWRMEVEGTNIRLYRNNNLYTTKTNCKVDYPKTLRLYPQNKSASVDYVKVKAL